MKKLYVLFLFFLFAFVNFSEADKTVLTVDNDRVELFLPKIETKITPKTKEAIINGVKAAGQFLKFLQEKNFFSTLTKISSVAGPIFMVASVVLDVLFLFLDIESPEMALMKKEFANLNNRIDRWSVEFAEIKRKIDWSSIQINYGSIENNIISLYKQYSELNDIPESSRLAQVGYFVHNYELNYKSSGDQLYQGLITTERIFSNNLCAAAQKYYQYHRKMVQTFITSNIVLLTQAMQIEAAYVKLKYNNTEASEFLQSNWQKKLNVLKEKMEEVDTDTKNHYTEQYQKDLDDLLKTRYSLSNQQFVSVAHNFFTDKYYWRRWFVVTYAELSGFKAHTVSTCHGTYRFRDHGRNIIVSSLSESEYNHAVSNNVPVNRKVIGYFYNYFSDKNHSLGWVNFIRSHRKYCSEADTVVSIAWGSNVWYMTSAALVYKKNCDQFNNYCYNTYIFG